MQRKSVDNICTQNFDLTQLQSESEIELQLLNSSDENLNPIASEFLPLNFNLIPECKQTKGTYYAEVNSPLINYDIESNDIQKEFRRRTDTWPSPNSSETPSLILSVEQPHRSARRGGNQSPGTFKGVRMTYAELITEAIRSSNDQRLTLQQIYSWMNINVPEFGNTNDTANGPTSHSWKNSIRHNLSLHSRFQKIQNCEPGKSSLWCLNYQDTGHNTSNNYYLLGDKRRRRGGHLPAENLSSSSYFTKTIDPSGCNANMNVPRDKIIPVPISSEKTISDIEAVKKQPTCPPNATVQADFQYQNAKKMMETRANYEENIIKNQYPLLASIIIRNSRYSKEKHLPDELEKVDSQAKSNLAAYSYSKYDENEKKMYCDGPQKMLTSTLYSDDNNSVLLRSCSSPSSYLVSSESDSLSHVKNTDQVRVTNKIFDLNSALNDDFIDFGDLDTLTGMNEYSTLSES